MNKRDLGLLIIIVALTVAALATAVDRLDPNTMGNLLIFAMGIAMGSYGRE